VREPAGVLMNELVLCQIMLDRADAIKSERDSRYVKGSRRWRQEAKRAAKLQSKAARIRREALHRWSTDIVSGACDLIIHRPAVKEQTASPRGDEKEWGAQVEVVSKLNRHILNQAPAMAIQMLEYKAAEAGIRCDVIQDEAPNIVVGAKLVAAGKSVRKAKRAIKGKPQ
jgi:transposase